MSVCGLLLHRRWPRKKDAVRGSETMEPRREALISSSFILSKITGIIERLGFARYGQVGGHDIYSRRSSCNGRGVLV